MREFFKKFRKSEDGATLGEYGVALILAIIIGGTALVSLAGDVEANMDCGGDTLAIRDTTTTLGC